MQAETCSWYVYLITYILCNKAVLDCKITQGDSLARGPKQIREEYSRIWIISIT